MTQSSRDARIEALLGRLRPRYYTHAVLAGPRHGTQIVALHYNVRDAEATVRRQQRKSRCARCPGGCFHIVELPAANTPAWHQSLKEFVRRNR